MVKKRFNIIKPVGMKPKPDEYEERVAEVVADYFKSDVKFVECSSRRSPDVLVARTSERWEIKNIRGSSKYTIQNNLREASGQSKYVIIGLLRTNMMAERARSRVMFFLKKDLNKFKKVLMVTKSGEILEIKKK